jgi:transglutaminase-like putative cysteine protease
MQMERILQICIAAMVSLSTVLLGMGEQNVTRTLAAVIVAFSSVYITDVKGWVKLPDRLADLLGLCAAVAALFQWQRDVSDAGLLALLSFVVYGQFVLQLKKKNIATYWLLIALSLMEAAVSTALNESLLFGLLLLAYVVLASGVLTVFYLYREHLRVTARVTGAESDTYLSSPGATPSRALQAPLFTGSAQQQQAESALNLPLARLVANVSVIALGLACAVFAGIPRSERGNWREVDVAPVQRMVGFSNEVQLGEMGAISESDESIMEVYLDDPLTRFPCELVDEPLFRGVTLTVYANRKWKQQLFRGKIIEVQEPPPGAPTIRQRIIVQPLDTDVLFAIYPSYSPVKRQSILWSKSGEQLQRTERKHETTIEYELLTTAIVDRRLSMIVQAAEILDGGTRRTLTGLPVSPRAGVDPLAGTKALAEQIVKDIPTDDHLERARVLTNFLRDPTNFRYSLNDVRRDPALDPVEDFVTQNRVGHCEYYASALALMLRAVGIPSRLAVGFKGGDWTVDHYEVRALHAHAWVEAYLEPDQLPERLTPGFDRSRGGWLILDPTGGVGAAPAAFAGNYVVEGFKSALNSVRDAWRLYVLGMNHTRQQESLYIPAREGIVAALVSLTDPQTWKNLARSILRGFSPKYWGLSNGGWFSWRGAIAAIVVMLAFLGSNYLVRFAVRRYRRWSAHGSAADSLGGADVAFYRRFETLLAERQLCRSPSQTQREFALAVGGQLAESPRTSFAGPLARQLVELFYRVRFGRRTLDSQEAAAVEQALSELADALALAGERRT